MTARKPSRRVALVASYAPSLTLFRGPLIRRITALGHEVLCAAPDLDDAMKAQLAAWGAEARRISLARTGLNPLRDFGTLRTLTALFREWSPDVVMGYTPKAAIYGALAANRAGVERIVPMITGLGYAYLEGGGARQAAIRTVMNRLYARAFSVSDGVIFHNRDDARVLTGLGLVPDDLPVTIVRGSGVDLDHYAYQPLPPLNCRITFLMIARLVRYKGVAEYCAAARLLKERGMDVRCLLVGAPETGPAGYPAARLDGHADVVDYRGASGDIRRELGEAHVYVLPSYGEGMPRTVLEALAAGRPVVTTDTRGCRETVRDGVNGYLVPIRDARALAAAMAKFVERPETIAPMARESRKLAEAEFDVARVNEAMLKALGLTGERG